MAGLTQDIIIVAQADALQEGPLLHMYRTDAEALQAVASWHPQEREVA